MKTNSITQVFRHFDPVLESTIQKKDAELKELARKNAKHLAKRNLPAPAGDALSHYIGDISAAYGSLETEVILHLQPNTHIPESKIDANYFREKYDALTSDIKSLTDQNHTDEYELENFSPGTIPLRLWAAGIASLIIFFGEVIYNTKSFQLIVENLLFSMILSVSISFTVFVSAHLASVLYKKAETKIKKWMVVGISLSLVSIVFIALSLIRSTYLASHDVQLNPFYFVIFNLFFFIASALLSYFILPSWMDIKQEFRHLKLQRMVKKRNKEIQRLKIEIENIRVTISQRTKERLWVGNYAHDSIDAIHKLHDEAVAIFMSTNIIHRTDRKTPDCFSEILNNRAISDISSI